MAKHLLLVRHAKSDWDNIQLSDINRTLNKRGLENAPEMAQRVLSKKVRIDRFVSSTAVRAFETAKFFAKAYGTPADKIQQNPSIYEAAVEKLLQAINSFDNNADTVAMFGHNPGLTNLVLTLCECDIYNIPTCGMVYLEFPFDDWQLVSGGTASLVFYDYPKNPENN